MRHGWRVRISVTALTRFAMVGYALPGTVMGLGLLFALARFDNALDAVMRECVRHLDGAAADRIRGGGRACLLDPLPGACRRLDPLGPRKAAAQHRRGRAQPRAHTAAQSARAVILPLLGPQS